MPIITPITIIASPITNVHEYWLNRWVENHPSNCNGWILGEESMTLLEVLIKECTLVIQESARVLFTKYRRQVWLKLFLKINKRACTSSVTVHGQKMPKTYVYAIYECSLSWASSFLRIVNFVRFLEELRTLFVCFCFIGAILKIIMQQNIMNDIILILQLQSTNTGRNYNF